MSHQGQRTKKRVGPHDLHGETASVLRRANKLQSTTGTKFTLQHLQDRKKCGTEKGNREPGDLLGTE